MAGILKISKDCIMAQLESASRYSPDTFVVEWLNELALDNGMFLRSLIELSEGFFPEELNKKKGIAFLALAMKIIAAQIESNDLEEQFNGIISDC